MRGLSVFTIAASKTARTIRQGDEGTQSEAQELYGKVLGGSVLPTVQGLD